MSYIIKPNDWDYIDTPYDTICSYMSDDYGFSIFVSVEREEFSGSNVVKVFGSCNSCLDYNNCYYYDLSDSEFASRAWVGKFGYAYDMLNDDDKIIVDIEIPNWFVDHASKMNDTEKFYIDIFCEAFENNNGASYNSLDGFVSAMKDYLDDMKVLYTENIVEDIIYVANENGYIMYNNGVWYANV